MDIHLENISVSLPGRASPLFRMKELAIPFGSKLLIEGASGKGKTTLLHLIAGLLEPTEGNIRIGSHVLSILSQRERSHLRKQHFGIIFQRLNLIEHLTARENVQIGLFGSKHKISEADRALDSTGLAGRYLARTSALSLGEQQRVAVARILACQPDIILADEPTSSLDRVNADLVMDSLFAAANGKSLIMVSHDERIRRRFAKVTEFQELLLP